MPGRDKSGPLGGGAGTGRGLGGCVSSGAFYGRGMGARPGRGCGYGRGRGRGVAYMSELPVVDEEKNLLMTRLEDLEAEVRSLREKNKTAEDSQ